MLIPQQYSRTVEESALFLVVSAHDAIFYLAQEGRIHVIEDIHVDNPRFSDREGQFRSSAQGQASRTGAPLEDVSDLALQEFLKIFEQTAKDILTGAYYQKIYLFCPLHLQSTIKKYLPQKYLPMIDLSVGGNYIKAHPLELIKKIGNVQKQKIVRPVGHEANKILNLPTLKFRTT